MKRVKDTLPHNPENDWARGCEKCKFGIASAPELTGAATLHLERLVQAIDGDVTFCTCKAGVRYQNYLRNRLLILRGEAKRDRRMASYAERGTHPDIEATRQAMLTRVEFVKVPPIRWVGTHDYPVPPEAQPETEPA